MKPFKSIPCALTIAGSDSGGGAGIQADLNTFSALGVHGTTAITCITAQNPSGVHAVQAVKPSVVGSQIKAVFAELKPRAIKTGMLYSKGIILEVVQQLEELGNGLIPIVVDPVMVATSGARLLEPAAERAMVERLFTVADLVTPNLDEAMALTGLTLRSVQDLRDAARCIHERWGCAALLKGGHLKGMTEAADIFFDGSVELLLSSPYVKGVSTHGTGCTYSAAIVAELAKGSSLEKAVAAAKSFISSAITHSRRVGPKGHYTLNWHQD